MAKRICVYCASSEAVAAEYLEAAFELGQILAGEGCAVVYGGGGIGMMGRLADGVLSRNGCVTGVIPRFMQELEWGHTRLTELQAVENMRERKHLMLLGADAVIALPGGCGTFEELLETITLKRLALYSNPIIILNLLGYFDLLLAMLERAIREGFMDARHEQMWQVISTPAEVPAALENGRNWPASVREFAVVRNQQT